MKPINNINWKRAIAENYKADWKPKLALEKMKPRKVWFRRWFNNPLLWLWEKICKVHH